MSLWNWCWAWYFNHGVPGNLAASAIWGLPALAGLTRVWFKHLRPHLERTRQIHEHLLKGASPKPQ